MNADFTILEQARTKLLNAAIGAYEDAALQGLCAEGAWEAAVGAMRTLDLRRTPRIGTIPPLVRGDFRVRPAEPTDIPRWALMRHALWPSERLSELTAEANAFFAEAIAEPDTVLVAEASEGVLIGFAELSLRAYAEDCTTSPVGFLEGWYVVPEARSRGVGRALVQAAEDWAREQGCSEIASDTRPDDTVSISAHMALGFEDAGGLRCFRKTLAKLRRGSWR
jgi:aminoglycoside 6'-N-acetyltransferase I